MTDNITLPREVVEGALEALDSEHPDIQLRAAIALRAALAAETPKQEPVAWMDRFGFVFRGKGPYETFTTPLYTAPSALAAEQPKHPGYIIGSHWLETAYSRICAGEAEADVLRDCGWERVDDAEALRRDAERFWMVVAAMNEKLKPVAWGVRAKSDGELMYAMVKPQPGWQSLGVLEMLPLYIAPPEDEAMRRDAFRKGFYAGFAATGEGWNGEYPFQDKNRPIAGDPSVEAAIDAAMGDKR